MKGTLMIHLTGIINTGYIIDADEQKQWEDIVDVMTGYRGYFAYDTEGRETTITISIPEDVPAMSIFSFLENAQAHKINVIYDRRL